MNKIYILGGNGLGSHDGHWFLFAHEGNKVLRLAGCTDEVARSRLKEMLSKGQSLEPNSNLRNDVVPKLDSSNYPEMLRKGEVRLVGGPTSDEIHDFSKDPDIERRVKLALFPPANANHYWFVFSTEGHKLSILLSQRFPAWESGTFAQFAVLQVVKYKRRQEYPVLAQALFELHQSPHAEEVEETLREIGSLNQEVGSEFQEFTVHLETLDPSLLRYVQEGYGTPSLAWVGLLIVGISGIYLIAHYFFGYIIFADTWNRGIITVDTFWVYLIIGLIFCGFFLKRPYKKNLKKPQKTSEVN